jgi:prepilin-type N-terminal cleavage/methylation domain-containing protein
MGAITHNNSSATSPRQTGRGGFTLTELLVVIGIGVLLMALLIPTGQALRAGNRALTCKSQLQQIGTALKAYYMDEEGAPPFYALTSSDLNDPSATSDYGPGLMGLYDAGYLARRESLHCPADVYASVGQDAYFLSYMRYDEDAAANYAVNRYSYLNTRGITDDTDPLYRRQLQPALDTDGNPATAPQPVTLPNWRPSDDAVITWCPFHTDDIEISDEGAYQVLFWDGSVIRVRESVMTDPAVGPDAAWKVTYTDAG